MYKIKIKFILLSLLSIGGSLYPEFLVVKQQNFGFSALSAAESLQFNDVIVDVLQKYQWPMCIGSNLSKHEKNELLAADKPYAEELFIQKKLNEILPNLYLRVVFIPTSLYELFCLIKVYEADVSIDQDLFFQALKGDLGIDFFELLKNKHISAQKVRAQIQQTFKNINKLFFEKQEHFKTISLEKMEPCVWMNINNALFNDLAERFSEIQYCKNGQEVSKVLEENRQKILKKLLNKLAIIHASNNFINNNFQCLLTSEKDGSRNKIIENVVQLEYQAREQNKAILFRGSTLEYMEVSMGEEPVKKDLIGTTLYQESDYPEFEDMSDQGLSDSDDSDALSDVSSDASNEFDDSYGDFSKNKIPFWKKYKEKNNSPYSISFGISLFAGFLNDPFACAYTYLSGCGHYDATIHDLSVSLPVGYAIFINKKDYVEHQNFNLFYIPSLATLPSLFECGQWFHARAKASKLIKNGLVRVIGAHWKDMVDPTGVLLVTRDPLKHAELFSNFLVQNGHLIQPGDASLLTDVEKDFAQSVMKAQTEVAQLYKAVRTMAPKIEKATKNFKEKRDAKFLNWMQDYQNL